MFFFLVQVFVNPSNAADVGESHPKITAMTDDFLLVFGGLRRDEDSMSACDAFTWFVPWFCSSVPVASSASLLRSPTLLSVN
jgi:hypothetical protein